MSRLLLAGCVATMVMLLAAPSIGEAGAGLQIPEGTLFVGLVDDEWKVFLGERDQAPNALTTASEPHSPAYSRSQQRVAYVSAAGELRELDLATRTETVLLSPSKDASYSQPTYRPGSSDLYFVVLKQGVSVDTDIARFDRSARRAVSVVRQRSAQFEPAFSSDGEELVYSSVSCASECANIVQDVWAMHIASGETQQRTMLNAISRQPALGPNGVLTFSCNRGGVYQLWQSTRTGTRQLTTGPFLDESPASADSGELYFVRRTQAGGRIMRRARSGAIHELVLPPGVTDVRDLRWSR